MTDMAGRAIFAFAEFFNLTPLETATMYGHLPLEPEDAACLDRIRRLADLLLDPAERWGFLWSEDEGPSAQSYLAAGPAEWPLAEDLLMQRFRKCVSPRIFEGMTHEPDVTGLICFLWRILRGYLSGKNIEIRNPMTGVLVDRVDERLALALEDLAEFSDGAAVCALLSLGLETNLVPIRCACLRGLSSFLGFPASRMAFRQAAKDPSITVRFEAVEALASRASIDDVREIIHLFTADPDESVRHQAGLALLKTRLRAGDEKAVLRMTMDPDEEIAAFAVRRGGALIAPAVRSTVDRAGSGEDLMYLDEAVMALSTALDPEDRANVFLERLEVLRDGRRPKALRRMLYLMGQSREVLPEPVWKAAAGAFAALASTGDEEAHALQFLFANRKGAGVAGFVLDLVRLPNIQPGSRLERVIIEKLGAESVTDENMTRRLMGIAEEGGVPFFVSQRGACALRAVKPEARTGLRAVEREGDRPTDPAA